MEVTAAARSSSVFPVAEASQVGEARRRVARLGAAAGLDVDQQGRLALVITELGSNLVKHAGGGVLLTRALEGRPVVEVLAVDRGPGMSNVSDCFRDGYSTAGSPGTGLGAVGRLSMLVDVYSARPGGTVIMARVGAGVSREPPGLAMEVGAVSVAKDGEDVCGDGWAAAASQDLPALMVVDGLGHGLGAADAARLAIQAFETGAVQPPAVQVARIHDALRGSRGAAVAVARLDQARGVLDYAGIGNVAGVVVSRGRARHLVSSNGTAGQDRSRVQEFSYPWPSGALLVMHSDGLGSRWQLERYPGLDRRHPSVIAAVLYRDWSRGRDDVTVVAARMGAA
ncbi:MAG TPA: SpoIIE family protein phosphatase [Methylomirabilota bacterium]|nr:SpoIIE family protein phosphatase [Methylomirabilota bacterium]